MQDEHTSPAVVAIGSSQASRSTAFSTNVCSKA